MSSKEEKKAIDKMNKFARVSEDMTVITAKEMDIVLKLVENYKKENELVKKQLKIQCEIADERNQLLVENKKLKDTLNNQYNRNKRLDKENQKLFEDFIENYIFKQEIRKKIEELNIKIADNDKTINECRKITGKNRGEKECIISRCRIKNVGYHETIKILQELLEGE